MKIFDQAFKNTINAPFVEEDQVQYEDPDTQAISNIDAIYTADEIKERINGIQTTRQGHWLEYDTDLFPLSVKANGFFIVRGTRYRVMGKPIRDETGMATCQLVLV